MIYRLLKLMQQKALVGNLESPFSCLLFKPKTNQLIFIYFLKIVTSSNYEYCSHKSIMIVVALTYSKHVQIEVLNETPRLPLNKRITFHRLGHSTIKSYHQVAKKKTCNLSVQLQHRENFSMMKHHSTRIMGPLHTSNCTQLIYYLLRMNTMRKTIIDQKFETIQVYIS